MQRLNVIESKASLCNLHVNTGKSLAETADFHGIGIIRRMHTYFKTIIIPHLFLISMIFFMVLVPKSLCRPSIWTNKEMNIFYRFAKRTLDILGAIGGLIVSFIFFLILPVLIRVESEGNAIFKQTRIGENRRRKDRRSLTIETPFERRSGDRRKKDLLGKPFQIYKFRSMRRDAEKKTGPIWAREDDPRVTTIGKIIRPWHLDEIPQFINVIKGDMSLVGPRPERPEFVDSLIKVIPDYDKRFKIKPGITGLAQVKTGYDKTIEDVLKKLKYDLQYLTNQNITTDLKILWWTLKELIPRNGNHGKLNGHYNKNSEHHA